MTKNVTSRLKLTGRRNQCPSCNEYFASLKAFDGHRVGPLGNGPLGTSPDRRCLTVYELETRNWHKEAKGFWMTPSPTVNPWSRKTAVGEG